MFEPSIAYKAFFLSAGVLIFLLCYLLGYTWWTRFKNQYWNRYEEKFRDLYIPILMNYIEGEEERDREAIVKKLTKRRQDYTYFLNLVDKMQDLVEGEGQEKLKKLREHERFSNYYRKKLFSFTNEERILGCIYFTRIQNFNSRIQARLVQLSKLQGGLNLSFAAVKALQAVQDITIRKNVLKKFLRRDSVSELMTIELLFHFDRDNSREHRQTADAFRDLLMERNISADIKSVIVRYIADHNFYVLSSFLVAYFKRIRYCESKAALVRSLIVAFGKLYESEAIPLVKRYAERQDIGEDIHISCVNTISVFGGKENHDFLIQQLPRVSFGTRRAIIYNLCREDEGIQLLESFLKNNKKMLSGFNEEHSLRENADGRVNKMKSIAVGVRTVLEQRMKDPHYV